MVNINLKYLSVLLLIISFNNSCLAGKNIDNSQLILFIDKTESIHGRPIRAELYGVSLKTKITNVKLKPLNDDFGVVVDYVVNDTSDKRWPGKSIQILKLKLYPRKTGDLTIPELSINSAQSQKKTIHIKQGKNSVPEVTFSTSSPYERQQLIIHVTLISKESSARLSVKGETVIDGFESTPLNFKRIKNTDGTYLLQTGWALSAIKSGILKLELPTVTYSVSGVSRKQFYFPIKTLSVKDLPSYLPPTIPVGKVTIKSEFVNTNILQTNSLSYWNISINGALNNVFNLPPVLRQIKSTKQVRFLPINSERNTKVTDSTLFSMVNYFIPFKALQSGYVTLPEIEIQYFDPDDAKLKTIIHHSENVFVLSFIWRVFFSLSIFFILFYAGSKIYELWQKHIYSYNKRAQVIEKLHDSKDIKETRVAIILIAEAEYWPKNITISQWAKLWKNKYQVSNNFEEFISVLSADLYSSNTNTKTTVLNKQLLNIVNNRKKVKYSF